LPRCSAAPEPERVHGDGNFDPLAAARDANEGPAITKNPLRTDSFLDHERAKSELKALIPEDAKEAIGHGVRAKRSRSGAVNFDVLEMEASRAAIQ
jgi:hypothetical protein